MATTDRYPMDDMRMANKYSPAHSSSSSRKRGRTTRTDEAYFLLQEEEAAGVRAAIEASKVGPDVKRRLRSSLQDTLQDVGVGEAHSSAIDLERIRVRTASDLSELAERLSTPGSIRPAASPCGALGSRAGSPPPLTLPPSVVQHSAHQDSPSLDTSDCLDYEGMFDHEQLMEAIYRSQGLDLSATQGRASCFLGELGLRPLDLGVKNTDERGRVLINQCFYLCIARAYLGHEAPWDELSVLALHLKRAIEVAVLAQRPSWMHSFRDKNDSGDEVEAMAFADFLPIAMNAGARPRVGAADANDPNRSEPNLLRDLAVCVLDSVQGHVEVFLGPGYADLEKDLKERNLILLWYTPGHYQCIVGDDEPGSKVYMSYEDFKDLLQKHDVMFIETTEY